MSSVQLNQEQQALRTRIQEHLQQLKAHVSERTELPQEQVDTHFTEMGQAAHQLHTSLNPQPTHHQYMIRNRGMSADHPEFYEHIHPVEDLLAYLDDTSANDDPQDVTVGDTFTMDINTNRWDHPDQYTLVRTATGWDISFLAHSGSGDKTGEPALSHTLGHDSVSYPRDLGSYMSSIWERANTEGLSHEQVQELLDQVANWISLCEKNSPQDILL